MLMWTICLWFMQSEETYPILFLFPLVFLRDNQALRTKHDLSALSTLSSIQSSLRYSSHLFGLSVRFDTLSLSLSRQGCVTYLDQPFQLEHTPARLCFQLRGKCQYFMCRKFKKEQCLSLAFICKNCEEVSNERNVLFVLRATSDIEVMKQQLNKLYGYLPVTAAQDKNARTGL